MTESRLLHLASVLIALGGVYMLLWPANIMGALQRFYARYPIVRYASEKQLTGRPGFIRFLGGVLILVGLVAYFSI